MRVNANKKGQRKMLLCSRNRVSAKIRQEATLWLVCTIPNKRHLENELQLIENNRTYFVFCLHYLASDTVVISQECNKPAL